MVFLSNLFSCFFPDGWKAGKGIVSRQRLLARIIPFKRPITKTIITWQPQNGNWKIWSYRLLVDLKRNSFLTLLATTSLDGGWVPPVSKGFHFGQPLPTTNYTYMASITAQTMMSLFRKEKHVLVISGKEWDKWLNITSHAAQNIRHVNDVANY